MTHTPLLARFLRLWLRSGLRGCQRVTSMVARYSSALQAVPIHVMDWPAVYVDLRDWNSHVWFRDSPLRQSPLEPEVQSVLRQFVHPGSVVYDIGANLGLHSALLSHIVGQAGHVYSFEPNPDLTPVLRRATAGMGNATLFDIALADQEGEADLFVAAADNSLTSLTSWMGSGHGEVTRRRCTLKPLDQVVAEHRLPLPDFIKCDVEGAEFQVFRGARGLLNQARAPVVLFESNVPASAAFGVGPLAAMDVLRECECAGYSFLQLQPDGTLISTAVARRCSNMLALPRWLADQRGRSA